MRPSILALALLSVFVVSVPASAAFLKPADLSPALSSDEQDFFDGIKGDATAAQNFLATRQYVRTAQAVANGSIAPLSLPARKPVGFKVDYLLPDDPTVINIALGMRLTAQYSSGGGASPWKQA